MTRGFCLLTRNKATSTIGIDMKSEEIKKKKLVNLKKAKSLVEKIIEMVEEDRYCIDIMQQNLAVIGMLKSFHQMLMETHLGSCFRKAMESGSAGKKEKMVKEILKVNSLYGR